MPERRGRVRPPGDRLDGQLRQALEGVPDDLPVRALTAEDDEQVVTSAGPWAHAEGSADSVRARGKAQVRGSPVSDLAEAVIEIGRLALVLGATDRTACWHPDGQQRESVADHTVMLGWVAPALAAKLYPGRLDAALVAEYALIHDMPEVHVGDTPTLRIDDAGRAAKAERENWAVGQIVGTFGGSLRAELVDRTVALLAEKEAIHA